MLVGPPTIPPHAALPSPSLPDTLIASLRRAARMSTPTDGLRFLDRRGGAEFFDWMALHDRALRVGADLRAAGVQPGERVAIVLPTEPAFIDVFLGILAAGAVPAPLYPPVRLGRMEEYVARTSAMLEACDAVAVVSNARVRRVLGKVVARARPRLGVIASESLGRGAPLAPVPRTGDDLALVQFSSGTTVRPKPVALTNRQVLANVDAILDFMPLDARDPDGTPYQPAGVSWLPLYHDMGLIGCVFVALRRPGPLTLLPPELFLARPHLWLRAISEYRGTVSPAPNFAYALCVEKIDDEDLEGVDLSSWRLALNGAEPVTPAVLRRFEERFAPYGLRERALTPVYGLSEAALAVSFSDPLQPWRSRRFSRAALASGRAKEASEVVGLNAPGPLGQDPRTVELCSVGRPLRGYGVEIRDEHGTVLPTGRVGRIWVSGPSLMRGYLDRDEQPLVDGWLDTGDRGFLYRGDLYIHGRDKDVIILNGANHAPRDIECAVDDVPGVRTGCAVAVSHVDSESPEGGERLVLFVEYREQRQGLAEDCRQAVQSRTGLDPSLVVLLAPGTLPRTSSGKLRRKETLAQFERGELAPPDRVTPWFLAGTMARSAWGYLEARRNQEPSG